MKSIKLMTRVDNSFISGVSKGGAVSEASCPKIFWSF